MADKYVKVNQTKEFATTFFADPILKMAVNACLDSAPAAEYPPIVPGHKDDNNIAEIAFKNGVAYCKKQIIEKLIGMRGTSMGEERKVLGDVSEVIRKMDVR